MRLIIAAIDFAELDRALFEPSPAEGAAFLAAEPDGETLRVRSFHVFAPNELEEDSFGGVVIKDDATVRELAAIKRAGLAAIEVHTHPGSGRRVGFSSYDEEQLPDFAQYVQNKLVGKPFGALVLAEAAYVGRSWSVARSEGPLELELVGELAALPQWLYESKDSESVDPSFDRQIRALGPKGQARLARLRVGVVGLGGTGSQTVQHLAHLGVRDFVLVDDDKVEASNLPRLAGGAWWDVLLHRSKASVARRTIRRLARRARVNATGALRNDASLSALRDVDVIIGCIDNDGARLVLAELAAAYLVPYLDLGVGIEGEAGTELSIGGRVSFYLPGGPCLACADDLDFAEAAEDLESEEVRKIRIDRGYARDRGVEPALMPLNTVIVGLGMIEILAFVTGVRPVAPFSRYDARMNKIVRSNVEIDENCPVCRPAYAAGARQQIERYVLV